MQYENKLRSSCIIAELSQNSVSFFYFLWCLFLLIDYVQNSKIGVCAHNWPHTTKKITMSGGNVPKCTKKITLSGDKSKNVPKT